ncbi:hypothetical protein [Saccharopolyspora phatthalungensis]|uniref:Uncharacterized protein n=1 Tax=Saccharopolyspora phatthalungensis TaxID=664693 RepID=A0A840QDK2_9PSEU|nr:hypothetical protein [Saccharopolyspora phatthalungensis]MBB5158854.1 hypothetical protein [Saccharopolyspora phatthalungensis]
MVRYRRCRDNARYLLASVRLANGVAGLVAPQVLIRRIEGKREPSPAAIYAFRLFGIRTVLLGLDLFLSHGDEAQQSLREGVVIHSCDVATVTLLAIQRRISRRTAALLALISTGNVALALSALRSKP